MLGTKKIIFLFTVLSIYGTVCGQNAQVKVEIRGTVVDSQTGETLPGAFVLDKDAGKGTATDADGSYVLQLSRGNHRIQVSFLGYQTKEFMVDATANRTVDFRLEQGEHVLKEVIVSTKNREENIILTGMGVEKMSIGEIRTMPVLVGEVDILKAIQLLPGVQAAREGGTGFSVRGGSTDQNLILLDNTTVYNPSHLMGFFSIFNNDVTGGLELYRGDLPAKYGGRLSSLLSVRTKQDIPSQFGGTGGVGLISSRLMLEGSVGENTSWIVAGRRSYADLFMKLSSNPTVRNSSVYFYDMNGKISHNPTKKDRIELNGYYGNDAFSTDLGVFLYGNTAASLSWGHTFSDDFLMKTGAHFTDYRQHIAMTSSNMHTYWDGGTKDIALKMDFVQNISDRLSLDYGLSSTYHRFLPGRVNRTGQPEFSMLGSNALEHAVYISGEQKPASRLTVRYGLRLSMFQNMGKATMFVYDESYNPAGETHYEGGKIYNTYKNIEPRIGGVLLLGGNSSLKAGYTRNVQYIQLAENSAGGSPVSVWFPASPNIKPQSVDMFSTGYFRNFNSNMFETSVEIYYKNLNNVIDYTDHAALMMNPYMEGEIRSGKGKAFGIEFTARKKSGQLTGFLNYTLSHSERTIDGINGGKAYLAPYDKTNSINISVNYKFSDKWNASALWVYDTGTPATFPTGRFEIDGEYFPVYSGRNEDRKPDYHRLDLSLGFIPKPHSRKRWKGEWNFSIYNAYGRKNPWIITYNQADYSTPKAEIRYIFSLLPSITYNFKF